jgi:xanthine dehydrogenase molybdenum-binding subunit
MFPGMLHGKVLRSPCAHARIRKIDVSKAERAPGVVSVITHRDVPRIPFSGAGTPPTKNLLKDEYILDEKVRFVGDKVAAVAALDEDTAEEALSLIEVEYEELPAVFDPGKAMQPDAPRIHEAENNIAAHVIKEWGDVERGFEQADLVFEGRYRTSRQSHCAIEPHACVADYSRASGELRLWTTTHVPFVAQRILSELLSIPMSKVRIIKTSTGGSFGGKNEVILEPLCALLSIKTGRPVKMVMTRDEVFLGTRTRHPCVVDLRTGVKRDGTLTARSVRVILDTGAYASHGPFVMGAMGSREIGLYRSPNVKFEGYCVYTNTPVSGAMRGYGNPQHTFAVESQMDEIAEELGMDPLEFRLKNAIRAGDLNIGTGMRMESCGLQDCMKRGAERIGWKRKRAARRGGRKRRGVGMAISMHSSGASPFKPECTSSVVTVNSDGTVNLFTGAADLGQGASTVLAQIVAEELGVGLEDVSLIPVDTGVVPFDQGAYASRTTYVVGSAARMAARDAKRQILEEASKVLGVGAEHLEVTGGKIVAKSGKRLETSIAEVIRGSQFSTEKGRVIIGKASFQPPGNAPYFGAQFAEVEVDTETGQVKILKVVSAQDVGKAINPLGVEGQMEGMVHMGAGYALTEGLLINGGGRVLNPNFIDYKILHATEMPYIETIIVESGEPSGPFGAKGLAEGGLAPTAPAIANAIYNAVGVRIREIPLTSERLLKELVKMG